MRTTLTPWLVGAVLLATACNGNQVSDSPSEVEVTPGTLEFGAVPVFSEQALDITVTNIGGRDLGILSVTLTEGDPDVWAADRGELDVLTAGTSGTVSVTFRPEDYQRQYTAEVQIRTDAQVGEPSTFVLLTGSGGISDADYDGDGFSVADGDCDDGNPYVNPGADEICDGIDNDCNGIRLADEVDEDYDGWLVCEGDCDDTESSVNPGAPEICDGLDNDCDNITPDNDDQDADGYTLCDGDCDDNQPNANPGRAEVCDGGIDNDCDGTADFIDMDKDGHTVCSAAGDCDDYNPQAFPVVISSTGSSYGVGTDADPYDSIATGLANLDQVCRTVIVEPGTYTGVGEDWSVGQVLIIGRTGLAADVTLEAGTYERHFTVSGGATLDLEGLTLVNGAPNGDGGAVQVISATLSLENVVIENNNAGADGGAIAVTPGTLLVGNNVEVLNNSAFDDGGAILATGATITDIDGTRYEGNDGTLGGAMRLEGGVITIQGATFDGNSATEGAGISLSGTGDYIIERSVFAQNSSNADGGGIAMQGVVSSAGYIRANRFQDNVANGNGGGLAILGGSADMSIHNNTMTGNIALAGEGAGIYSSATDASAMGVTANVLHSSDGASGVYVVSGAYTPPVFSYNTAYGTNSGIDFGGIVGDGYGGPNPIEPSNVVRNPLLLNFTDDGDPTNDDLGLQGASPEIDDGPPFATFNDTDGSLNDRGYTGGPAGG